MDEPGYADAVDVLRNGGVVAFPTDTVYGVGAAIDRPEAIARLFEVKGRAHTRAIAVLVADAEQARTLGVLDARAAALVERWWPGALTLVVDRQPDLSIDLGGDPATIGLRCPADELVHRLCREVGPLATTSANRSGEPTSPTPTGVSAALGDRVDLVVDDGHRGTVASTLVSLVAGGWEVLRIGQIDPEELRAAVGDLT